ncbi:Cytochrome P450 89A2 [Linum grandiflorum]
MEDYWFLILVSLSIAVLLKSFINLFSSSSAEKSSLPPGPVGLPFIGNLILEHYGLEPLLPSLHQKYGPIVTLRIGSRIVILVADRALAHRILIQKGSTFADRPPANVVSGVISSNQHNISDAFYGPIWRLLRRNLTARILHPSRVRSYAHVRARVLDLLKARIIRFGPEPVKVMEEFQYAMFYLMAVMCFGDELDEKQILEVKRVERMMLLNIRRFRILNFAPRITRILMRKRWSKFLEIRKEQEDVIFPLIRSRKELKKERAKKTEEEDDDNYVMAYIDTLLDLELSDGKRKLTESEIVSICNEFISGGTDTSANVLQWIMANLVKYPDVQTKMFDEIKTLGIAEGAEIMDKDLPNMEYLKAVVLEGLRLHPPAHLLLQHTATTSVAEELGGGYTLPKGASVNFMVAEMGRDPKVWKDPMSFRPERFLDETNSFDLNCAKEIKMMPFGAGRRMCPAYALALHHLEYFLANLVWSFEWTAVPGEGVDLSEGEEFTVVMKNPLKAYVSPRFGMIL